MPPVRHLYAALGVWALFSALTAVAASLAALPAISAPAGETLAWPSRNGAIAIPFIIFALVAVPVLTLTSDAEPRVKLALFTNATILGGTGGVVMLPQPHADWIWDTRGEQALILLGGGIVTLIAIAPVLVRAMRLAFIRQHERHHRDDSAAQAVRGSRWTTAAVISTTLAAIAPAVALEPLTAAGIAAVPGLAAAIMLVFVLRPSATPRLRVLTTAAIAFAQMAAVAFPLTAHVASARMPGRYDDVKAHQVAAELYDDVHSWPGRVWVHRDIDVVGGYPIKLSDDPDNARLVHTVQYDKARYGVRTLLVATTSHPEDCTLPGPSAAVSHQAPQPVLAGRESLAENGVTCTYLDRSLWRTQAVTSPHQPSPQWQYTLSVPVETNRYVAISWTSTNPLAGTPEFARELRDELVVMSRDEVSVDELAEHLRASYANDAPRGRGIDDPAFAWQR